MIWLAALFGVYICAMLLVAWLSLNPPARTPVFFSAGALGAPQEDWIIESDGLKLRAWWVPAEGADTVAVLSHGYLMNRAELSPLAFKLWEQGISCLLLDLRAHGHSQGRRSSLGVYEAHDVCAAVSAARQRVPDARVVLIGSSMGSAASVFAADQNPGMVQGLILDSCYSKLDQAIIGWWRLLGGKWLARLLSPTAVLAAPMAGFNPFQVDVAAALARIGEMPVLFLHGDRDSLALPSEAVRNHSACMGPTELVWLEGCGHSEGRWMRPDEYESAVIRFFGQVKSLNVSNCDL